jgi:hypothetical protein
MPVFYWRERVGSPKLRITKLTSIFAQNIGQMNLMFDDESDQTRIDSNTSSDDLSSDESEVEPSVPDKVSAYLSSVEFNLPDPKKYPLLHSMGCNAMIMDRLVQEILLFHGNNQITFTHGNNQKGTLVILPSHRHIDRYEAELSKKKSTLDTIINTVIKNSQSTKEEATECLLRSMFMKYENSFVSVAMNKCVINDKIIDKKMDVISTEAMIQEANISTNSARIISHHLRQHFGQS